MWKQTSLCPFYVNKVDRNSFLEVWVQEVDNNPLLGCEYRKVLNCMSSKTGSHHIVGVSREARIES